MRPVNKGVFFLLLIVACFPTYCQFTDKFRWPLDSPLVISGNYGELRPNHFHAGLDFSTRGQINLPVYCIADGYISRIRVSSGGYGKSIYVTHSNGKVSLYAHLNSFSKNVAALVKNEQYAKQSFEVEILPGQKQLLLKKHEVVGLSGNSGSSTAPHLHFEVRDELSETPLNPLQFYKSPDRMPPTIEKLAFYDLGDTSRPVFLNAIKFKRNGAASYKPIKDSLLLTQSVLGLAFSAFDQLVENGNHTAVFSAKVYLDKKLIYAHSLKQIDFSEHRFVNEFSQVIGKNKYQKCFLPTLYPLNFYEPIPGRGRITLQDADFHLIKLVLGDENKNECSVQFYVRTLKPGNISSGAPARTAAFVNCSMDHLLRQNKTSLLIPARTLYYSTELLIHNEIEEKGQLFIFPPEANLRNAVILGLLPPPKFSPIKSKLVLTNHFGAAVPTLRNDSLFYAIKNFGKYKFEPDTVAPSIQLYLDPRRIKHPAKMNAISFRVKDKLSGIGKYNLYLNGKWVLAEYDAKFDRITYFFDEKTPAGALAFKLNMEDKVGNQSTFIYTLKR
jgi:hypothetical protein